MILTVISINPGYLRFSYDDAYRAYETADNRGDFLAASIWLKACDVIAKRGVRV